MKVRVVALLMLMSMMMSMTNLDVVRMYQDREVKVVVVDYCRFCCFVMMMS